MNNLGKWIIEKHKTQAAFAEELGVQQSRVSKWLSGREPIPETFQRKIQGMKYKGPWPVEEAKEAAAPTSLITDALFYREIGKLEGKVEALERVVKNLLEGYQAHILKEPGKAHPQAPQQ